MTTSLSINTYGQGRPLVLLHGWGFSQNIWATLLPELTPHFQVTVVDLPGHGKSSLLHSSPEKLVDQLIQRTPPGAIWMGWSLGGMIALAVAKYHLTHIQQLLLVASTPKFLANSDWDHGIAPAVLERFSSQLKADPPATLSRFITLQAMGHKGTREILAHVQKHIPSHEGLNWGLELLRTLDLRDHLTSITCPVNAIFGAKDTLIPIALADYLPQNYPNVSTHVLVEAGHMPFYSHPELFMQWLSNECNIPILLP